MDDSLVEKVFPVPVKIISYGKYFSLYFTSRERLKQYWNRNTSSGIELANNLLQQKRGGHMQGLDTCEKRCHERILFAIPQPLNMKGVQDVYLVGLSDGGAEIACLKEPNLKGTVQISLTLPQEMFKMSIKGEVVWQRKEKAWHLGVQFLPLSNVDKLVLEAYVDYLKRDKLLLEVRKKINLHLDSFIKNFERLLALGNCTENATGGLVESRSSPREPQSRYLH